jgi:hypothetical protein
MKKITYSVLFSFIFLSTFAQVEFKKSDGTIITNGMIIPFETVGSTAYLNFRVKNISTTPQDIKIKCISLVNATGSNFELCYGGSCFDSVAVNGVYPDYPNPLAPGQSNPSQGDHFVNFNVGTGGIMDYVFSVYALGSEANAITFTYRYAPNLSVNTLEGLSNLGISITNTVVADDFLFSAAAKGNLSLYNLNGQLVKELNFTEGSQNINLSNLNTSIYIARFTNAEGISSNVKIIKQ